ncbi:15800_t:CDS:2, partial [Racocetra persica]
VLASPLLAEPLNNFIGCVEELPALIERPRLLNINIIKLVLIDSTHEAQRLACNPVQDRQVASGNKIKQYQTIEVFGFVIFMSCLELLRSSSNGNPHDFLN